MITLKIEVEIEEMAGCYQAIYDGNRMELSADDHLRAVELLVQIGRDILAERQLTNLLPSSLTGYYVECAK